MVSDRRDADSHYMSCTAFLLFDNKVAVGFARDRGEKDVFAMGKSEARLTQNSAYPVWLKVDDGETLVTGDVAFDKMLIVPRQQPLKLFQKLRKGDIW